MEEAVIIHNKEFIVLSVIIICHNQRDVVRRCIDSVLQQQTTFPVEVIVSDDRSTDGTREMLLTDYKEKVISTFFDSDNCNTSFTLERAGYNRLNGLKLARGKYLIHTDGDDFFTSTDLFQEMVDTLEAHPECNLCCQNYCIVDSNDINTPHIPQIKSPILNVEQVLTAQEFFSNVLLVNACFCVRREFFNSNNLWGGTYDDNYITARYVANGKIAILNRCDFVYVHYDHSSCSTIGNDEKNILFQPQIGMVEFAPAIAGAMLKKYTGSFFVVSKYAVKRDAVIKKVKPFCSKFDCFIFQNIKTEFSLIKWFRYLSICVLTYAMCHTRFKPKFLLRLLYRLAIGKIKEEVVL